MRIALECVVVLVLQAFFTARELVQDQVKKRRRNGVPDPSGLLPVCYSLPRFDSGGVSTWELCCRRRCER